MYSRSYPDMNPEVLIPESYGGIALGGKKDEYIENEEQSTEDCTEEASATPKGKGLFSLGGIGSALTGLFPSLKRGKLIESFGTEELLLIGAALLLFFSKEGDKECAILLILLLFLG